MEMKFIPNPRNVRKWKYSGSLRHISSEHLDHNRCSGLCFGGSPSWACFSCKLSRNRCLPLRQFRSETAFSLVVSSICHDLFVSLLLVHRLASTIFSASFRLSRVGQSKLLTMSKLLGWCAKFQRSNRFQCVTELFRQRHVRASFGWRWRTNAFLPFLCNRLWIFCRDCRQSALIHIPNAVWFVWCGTEHRW